MTEERPLNAVDAQTVPQAIEAQVRRTPEAVALRCGSESLSYAALDALANQLAHHLRQLGAGPDVLIGIALERSIEMVVALLAILKAGSAYVPLDTTYPASRLAVMIEDSKAGVILASARTCASVEGAASRVVLLDGEARAIAAHSAEPLAATAAGENLAYVIYTSGSTGKPKGVMIEHRNVINFFAGMDARIGSAPGVWLAVTSVSFDISVLELLWTLSRGFEVIVHGEEGVQTIPAEIRGYGVTHLQSTPSLARMVSLLPDGLEALGRVKKLFLGGEALSPSLVAHLRQSFHGEFYNMYGPTETTIWSTVLDVVGAPEHISIGTAIRNTQLYVLDSALRPVTAGETGELYIGGDGVVRGYWQRPELSAERFLDDPFLSGNRMYRTGDLARFLPDGNLDFLGRADFQIKLRGYRIEIGEIEAVLEKQPGVLQAVVIAREFKPEDTRLIAFVIAQAGAAVAGNTLRVALSALLPSYMVPAHFALVQSFPLTANGKVDRKALSAAFTPETEVAEAAPEGSLEALIAQTWRDALSVESVGTHDNFFDLGAHSLMVAEVHLRLQQQLGREFSLVDLFQYPTVHALAGHLGGEETVAVAEAAATESSRAERRLSARQQKKRTL